KSFSEYEHYMIKKLYANQISWAKAYVPLQFNAGIQSTQSVKLFNAIIKKSLNNTSTLWKVKKELYLDIMSDNFIEDVVNELQAILKFILSSINISKIIEIWKLTITKRIICRHFQQVMLYSNIARFHISIILIQWYKDGILVKLDKVLKNLLAFIALKPLADNPIQANLLLKVYEIFKALAIKKYS
ncbi:16821_t:CDS:2, partial [Gigaspora margarita]